MSELDEPTKALLEAFEEKNIAKAKNALSNGADIHGENVSGENALTLSLRDDWKRGAVLLLENGFDINRKDSAGYSPVHQLVFHDRVGFLPLFDKHGADFSVGDFLGRSAMYLASSGDMVRSLHRRGIPVDYDPVPYCGVPFSTVFARKSWDAAGTLIRLGARPIMHTDAPLAFMSKSAVYDECRTDGNFAVTFAAIADRYGVDRADENGKTALMFLSEGKFNKAVEFLLKKGANVGRTDKHNFTALHFAMDSGSSECVRLLLAAGADPNAMGGDEKNLSPLDWCLENGRNDCGEAFEHMIRHGADMKGCDDEGFNLLYRGCRNGFPKIVETLLKAGCDPNEKSAMGRTPLHSSPLLDGQDGTDPLTIYRLLIQHGIDVNGKDTFGDTALHTSAPSPDVVRLLISEGFDTDIKNDLGMKAVAEFKHQEAIDAWDEGIAMKDRDRLMTKNPNTTKKGKTL